MIQALERALRDSNSLVFNQAVIVASLILPEESFMELFHKHFKRTCETLINQELQSIAYISHVLAVYASKYLLKPSCEDVKLLVKGINEVLERSMSPCSILPLVSLRLYISKYAET